jgi:DNA-directed RNA polymerase specialized sigma24 family protein
MGRGVGKEFARTGCERVREQVDDRQFQVFDLYVSKGWSAAEVAQTLGISVARIYLVKHRVAARLKKEMQRLERLDTAKNRAGPNR